MNLLRIFSGNRARTGKKPSHVITGQGVNLLQGDVSKHSTGRRWIRYVSLAQRPYKKGESRGIRQISFTDRAVSHARQYPGIHTRLLEYICRLLATQKRVVLSINSGYLMKDCLQIGTVSNQALIKMTGKAGMLLVADLNFHEITV